MIQNQKIQEIPAKASIRRPEVILHKKKTLRKLTQVKGLRKKYLKDGLINCTYLFIHM